ncbi:6-phospho-3-hexuloisomerase [Providencia burhodogranariea]|uniref:3-hexulose-6-phosphate isomerase n=1 Tax=Providencia burhodogranariea DSM 19968 TaxID=1141662 RepID=K8WWR9_9GAMM|nr:6-phospho-3-hexuloisomerase [Providencia burhodogranariea]EKT61832.1 3-hexulose-6-phosphate isomerase [Providencia burhodogranariea DSM 19968]
MDKLSYIERVDHISQELRTVLSHIDPAQTDDYIAIILASDKIFVTGVGRVLLALETMVKRFNHLGISAHIVGAVNEPPISKNDLLIVGSGSGESLIPKHITLCAKKIGAKIAHLTSSPHSSIAQQSDVIVNFKCGSKSGEGTYQSIQPMTTLFEQSLMVFGDIICLELMQLKELSYADVSKNHANLE